MKKATFIGTVVAGTSQQAAIASYLETVNGSHDNSKVVCGVSESSDVVFLTSLSNIARPLSPLTGQQTCTTVIDNHDKIADKLQLMGDGEMIASGKFELRSSTCHHCQSHLVSDNADLLSFCVVCGEKQSDEDEGEENVDVSVLPEVDDASDYVSASGDDDDDDVEDLDSDDFDSEDDDPDMSASDEVEMEGEGVEILVEAMNEEGFDTDVETLKAVINGENSDESEELKNKIVELLGESVFEQAVEDGNLEDVLIDALLEGSDEEESNSGEGCADDGGEDDDIDESVLAAILASDDDEFEEDESEDDEVGGEVNASKDAKVWCGIVNLKTGKEIYHEGGTVANVVKDLLPLKAGKFNKDWCYAGDVGDEGDIYVKGAGVSFGGRTGVSDFLKWAGESKSCNEGHSSSPAVTEDQNKGTIGAGNKFDTDIEDTMEVDLLEDNIGASASLSSNKVQLVYAPSDNVGETKWFAVVNNAPVAVATMHSVGAEKASMFTTDSFRKGTETLMAQLGVAEGLMGMGFQSMKVSMPVKNIVASHVAEATAAVTEDANARITSVAEDVRAALATAAVGINKGFFSSLSNPIKAQLFDVLSAAGVKNADVLIDNAFDAAGDDYHRTLLAKAFDLMAKPVEARNEISHAVMTASYQRAHAGEAASLSSSVGRRLSHIGASSGMMTASAQATPSHHRAADLTNRISSVVGGLYR